MNTTGISFPTLPEGQRWYVKKQMFGFFEVQIQKKNHFGIWTKWRASEHYTHEGRGGVIEGIDYCLNYDRYMQIRGDMETKEHASKNQIPYGTN